MFFNLFGSGSGKPDKGFGKPTPQDEARLVPQCRAMLKRDLSDVLSIFRQCTGKTTSDDEFLRVIKLAHATSRVRIDEAGRVVGYYVYSAHSNYFRLLNLMVRPVLQHRRHGSAMLVELAGKLSHGQRDRIFAAVPDSLPQAQGFFCHHGFRVVNRTGCVVPYTHYELRLAPEHVEAAEAACSMPSV